MNQPTNAVPKDVIQKDVVRKNVVLNKAEALQISVVSMVDAGMDRYDPVRFHYIKTLCNKAALDVSDAVAERLCLKAEKMVERYEADIHRDVESATEWVQRAVQLRPDSQSMLDALLQRFEIRLAQRMAKKVVQRHEAQEKPSLLALFEDEHAHVDDPLSQSFEKQLLHHEAAVQKLIAGDDDSAHASEGYQFSDLKSYHLFKDSSIKLHADYLVTKAIEEVPKNAGPLNSHRLAVNSIEMMQDLSPAYLKRFVSYMDTLLWLEKGIDGVSKSGKGSMKR